MRRLLLFLGAAVLLAAAHPGDIAFILGKDEPGAPALFTLAEAYFRQPGRDQAEVVTGLGSLREVLDRLAGPGRPWRRIHLVVHGDPRGRMDLPLAPGGEPLSEADLATEALALPAASREAGTEVQIQGCTIGRPLVAALSRALGVPVRATRAYTAFRRGVDGQVSRSLCEGWHLVHRPGEPPSVAALVQSFRRRTGVADLDVRGLLRMPTQDTRPGAWAATEGPVSFTWTLVYPWRDLPGGLDAQVGLRGWLAQQEAFQGHLRRVGLRLSDLHWTARRVEVTWKGQVYPAVEVRGLGRRISLYRVLGDDGGQEAP